MAASCRSRLARWLNRPMGPCWLPTAERGAGHRLFVEDAPRWRRFLAANLRIHREELRRRRIPGGYFKREGRPTEAEILVSRLMDRPSRPLFPKGYRCETQVIAMSVAFDREKSTDVLAMTGARRRCTFPRSRGLSRSLVRASVASTAASS